MAQQPTFANALRKVRKKLRLTQQNLADTIGASRSVIAGIEGGAVPTADKLQKILEAVGQEQASKLKAIAEAQNLASPQSDVEASEAQDDDMIAQFMSLRLSREVDLSGEWNAMWLTTTNGEANRNREVVTVRKRLDGSWQFSNNAISDDNPDGGFLWVAKLELFDNKHILGYYCARERAVLAKGTLCLELQPNGREIFGVWDGLNFDTMWAQGLVALCRSGERMPDAGNALDRFIKARPKMPY